VNASSAPSQQRRARQVPVGEQRHQAPSSSWSPGPAPGPGRRRAARAASAASSVPAARPSAAGRPPPPASAGGQPPRGNASLYAWPGPAPGCSGSSRRAAPDQQRKRVPAVASVGRQPGAQQLRPAAGRARRAAPAWGEARAAAAPPSAGRRPGCFTWAAASGPAWTRPAPGPGSARPARSRNAPSAPSPAARPAPAGTARFQLGRDWFLIGVPARPAPRCQAPPVRIGRSPARAWWTLLCRSCGEAGPVDREPGQRIAEPHRPAELDQPGLGRGPPRPCALTPEHAGRLPDQHRIQRRLRPRPPAAAAASPQAAAPAAPGSSPRPAPPAVTAPGSPKTAPQAPQGASGEASFQQAPRGLPRASATIRSDTPLIQPARDPPEDSSTRASPSRQPRRPPAREARRGHASSRPGRAAMSTATGPARQVGAPRNARAPRRRLIQPLARRRPRRSAGDRRRPPTGRPMKPSPARRKRSGPRPPSRMCRTPRPARRACGPGKKPEQVKERRAQLVQAPRTAGPSRIRRRPRE